LAAAARHRAVRKFTADKLARIVRIIPQGLPVLTAAVDLSWHNPPLSLAALPSVSLSLSLSLTLSVCLYPAKARPSRFVLFRSYSLLSVRRLCVGLLCECTTTILDSGSLGDRRRRERQARGSLGEERGADANRDLVSRYSSELKRRERLGDKRITEAGRKFNFDARYHSSINARHFNGITEAGGSCGSDAADRPIGRLGKPWRYRRSAYAIFEDTAVDVRTRARITEDRRSIEIPLARGESSGSARL